MWNYRKKMAMKNFSQQLNEKDGMFRHVSLLLVVWEWKLYFVEWVYEALELGHVW